jgi:NDP-sugar pyrophosphorylase family protein
MNDSCSLNALFEWTDPDLLRLFGSPENPWQLIESLGDMLDRIQEPPTPLAVLKERHPSVWFDPKGRYWIDPTASLEPGAYLSGSIVARPHCVVGHCARLRGPVYLGPNARVGHGSEIKNSLLLPGATAAHLNFVGDSILGEGANLGAGAICANLRFDGRPIEAMLPCGTVPTGRRKCGALVGFGVQIGCSCTLAPGTAVGPNSWVLPNLFVRGWVAPNSRLIHASSEAHARS